jgi:hypothetical protein
MTQILTRLTVFNFFALLATFTAGLVSWATGGLGDGASQTFPLHLYLGLFTVSSTLALHCLVFVYFLGTGRWVKEVGLAYGLPDEPLPRLTRDLKRQAFPAALFAMLTAIATAAAGAGQHQGWPGWIHLSLATLTVLVNVWAFIVEYRTVRVNGEVIDGVMHEVDRIRAERGLPSNAEALSQEHG